MKTNQSSEVTLIVNSHREGNLLHKTLRGAKKLIAHAKQNNISVKTLLVSDSPDESTSLTIQSHKEFFDKIITVDYRDLAESRNAGVANSTTEFLTFLDADDFYGENWITECVKFFQVHTNTADIILRPELVLSFENKHDFWVQIDQESNQFDYGCILQQNPWASITFGKKSTYSKVPFKRMDLSNGFTFEDWHWNTELIQNGVLNKIVPKTAYFYRKKKTGSNAQLQSSLDGIIYRNDLFENTKLLSKRGHQEESSSKKFRSIVFEPWLKSLLKTASESEYALYPCEELYRKYGLYVVKNAPIASFYTQIYSQLVSREWDYFFFGPWLKKGGADLGTIFHINLLATQGKKVCFFSTEDTDSPWIDRLHKDVMVIEIGKIAASIGYYDLKTLLLRIVIQAKPRVIHNINSMLCWDLYKQYGNQLKTQSYLYASLYCEDRSKYESVPGSYAVSHLEDSAKHLTGIFSDNTIWPKHWVEMFGLKSELFTTAYFPTNVSLKQKSYSLKKKKVVWASRLDPQKQPEIVLLLSFLNPEIEFHVFGDTVTSEDNGLSALFEESPNIFMRGSFNGLASILDNEEFAAFLYTSLWDGIPNILLEAIACFIPIVSTKVGGIGEILNESNAYLIDNPKSVNQFNAKLKAALNEPEIAFDKALKAQECILYRHNLEVFSNTIKNTKPYYQN